MNYLLVVIDVLSKYVWVRLMKNKTARSLLEAFDSILSEGRKPEKLRTDKGTKFLNESFQQYLKKKNIQFYTANNEPKGKCSGASKSNSEIQTLSLFHCSQFFTLHRYVTRPG